MGENKGELLREFTRGPCTWWYAPRLGYHLPWNLRNWGVMTIRISTQVDPGFCDLDENWCLAIVLLSTAFGTLLHFWRTMKSKNCSFLFLLKNLCFFWWECVWGDMTIFNYKFLMWSFNMWFSPSSDFSFCMLIFKIHHTNVCSTRF